MNGPAVGRAHVPHKGMGTVFADSPESKSLTVVLDKTGERVFIRRDRIEWRKA